MAVMLHLMESGEGWPLRDHLGNMFTTTYSDQTIRAFKLVCQLADAAPTASGKSEAIRMGVQLIRIITPFGLVSSDMAKSLAQAAAKLGSDEIDSTVEDLVGANGPKQLGTCIQLVAASRASETRQKRVWTALMTALGIHQRGGQLPASYSTNDVVALAKALLVNTEGKRARKEPALSFVHFNDSTQCRNFWMPVAALQQ
jgi:hypothetical protein